MKQVFHILALFVCLHTYGQSNSDVNAQISEQVPENEKGNSYKTLKALKTVISSTRKPNYNIDTSVINQLNRFAVESINKDELENAKGFFTLSLKQAEKQHYWKGIADGLLLKGEYQILTGLSDSSVYTLQCAIAYYNLLNDTLQEKRAYKELVSAYYIKGDNFSAQLWSPKSGNKLDYLETNNVLFFGLYIGALIFCVIYNLFLYRFTNDVCYKELAKGVFAFTIFIYTTNNDFATQFSRNLTHFTILELLKVNSIFFSTCMSSK
jgi:hypothetical protein